MMSILKETALTILNAVKNGLIIIACLLLIIPVCILWGIYTVVDETYYISKCLIRKELIYKRRFNNHGYVQCHRLYIIKHDDIEYCFSEYYFWPGTGYLVYKVGDEAGRSIILPRLPKTRGELDLFIAYL